jgi:hypothetical protein
MRAKRRKDWHLNFKDSQRSIVEEVAEVWGMTNSRAIRAIVEDWRSMRDALPERYRAPMDSYEGPGHAD